MNRLNLAENLIRFRHEKKLTQEEVADFLGVTKASVSKWEKGVNTPDLLLLPQLAAFFGVTVDRLIGYEAQLSSEQIRRQYAELSKGFADLPFTDVLGQARSLAHQYYACYPFLLQLGVLYCNHYMLAPDKEEQEGILREALGWCSRILENCSDVGVCSDALVLKALLHLQLGEAAEAIEALEPSADPSRFAGQDGALLVQAYQLAGDMEKARCYAQVRQYVDLLNLVGDAALALSLHAGDSGHCEETIRRTAGIIGLYHLESLHPNLAAQFYYQAAVAYGMNGKEREALEALGCFGKCVEKLLGKEPIRLHGDSYFHLLDAWIDCLPLGSMAPRDQSFIRQSLQDPLAHPAFDGLREKEGFQRLVRRLVEGGGEDA
ncbi:MAG: helix-turn-helix transcriptional regulator [Lachnospiraceae bacterium]|jgi:transcriptional regulator with XRE-family HTH domain|nr:helix-turn-helix transcriptional regulator [Lachnospiraceae bacterium]